MSNTEAQENDKNMIFHISDSINNMFTIHSFGFTFVSPTQTMFNSDVYFYNELGC